MVRIVLTVTTGINVKADGLETIDRLQTELIDVGANREIFISANYTGKT